MKELILTLSHSDLPKYQILADAIRSAIRSGKLKPAEVLPSSRQMAETYGNLNTLQLVMLFQFL